MFGGETVSLFEVLVRVLKGHFGKMFFCPSEKIVQHNQAIIALLIRQSFLLVLVRIQAGPPLTLKVIIPRRVRLRPEFVGLAAKIQKRPARAKTVRSAKTGGGGCYGAGRR
jgi:hypothetical protein